MWDGHGDGAGGVAAVSRYARRVDSSHQAVARTLRACGWWILDMSRLGGGAPDLLAIRAGTTLPDRYAFIECKPPKDARFTEAQRKFYADCQVPVVVLKSEDEALAWAKGEVGR